MRTHTIAILAALLGFGSAFGVSRFGVHREEAAAAARPIAFDVPAKLRVGKVALPADAPALVPRRKLVPHRIAPAPAPPPPAAVRRPPPRRASPPPTPRQTQPAPAPETTPSQQTARRPQTIAPAQTPPPPPPKPPARRSPPPAPKTFTIIGGD